MATTMTTKNLTELSEILDSEDLAYKKCKFYANCAQDATLKAKLNGYATHHKQRFDALFNYLNSQK